MQKLKNIKLLVTDMDGTLLNDKKELDSEIITLLPALKERNIIFTFASGRNVHIMKDFVDMVDLKDPYITNNGANMFQGSSCIYESSIEAYELGLSLAILEKENIPYIAYTNEAVYIIREDPQLTFFLNRLKGKVSILTIASHKELKEFSIFKVVVIHENASMMEEVLHTVNAMNKETHMVRSEGDIYTITNIKATKGKTLLRMMELLHAKPNEVVVFGDNYNDRSMFEEAAYSVAMENADEEIKRAADFVTASNNENGVSAFIKKMIL